MARLAPLLLLLLPLVASFNPFTDDLTTDYVRTIVTKTLNNSFFSTFILADVKEQLTELIAPENNTELQNLVNLFNDYRIGNLTDLPQSRTETLAFLRVHAPQTYKRAEILLSNFLAKFGTLSQPAKSFFNDMEKICFNGTAKSLKQQVRNNINMAINLYDKWRALSPNIKAEYRTNWPEIVNFIECPYYSGVIALLKQGQKNGNVEQIFQNVMGSWKTVVHDNATSPNDQTGGAQEVQTQDGEDGSGQAVQTSQTQVEAQ